jgi:hypothetical protein
MRPPWSLQKDFRKRGFCYRAGARFVYQPATSLRPREDRLNTRQLSLPDTARRALIETPFTTVVPEGHAAEADEYLNIVLRLSASIKRVT